MQSVLCADGVFSVIEGFSSRDDIELGWRAQDVRQSHRCARRTRDPFCVEKGENHVLSLPVCYLVTRLDLRERSCIRPVGGG